MLIDALAAYGTAAADKAPHFADGIERQAYEASHAVPVNPAHVVLAEQARRIEHLEGVAERQADQHRVDALRIKELEAELAMAKLTGDRQRASIRAALDGSAAWRTRYYREQAARDEAANRIAELADERDALNARLDTVMAQLDVTVELVERIQATQH